MSKQNTMKTKIKVASLLILISFLSNPLQAQWDLNGNPVAPGQFLGSTNNGLLDLRQNNTTRTRYQNVVWQGHNNAPAVTNANRIHYGLNGNNQVPFSIMHLGQNITQNLYRRWMNVGTTYGAGSDIMYAGLLQSPTQQSNASTVDAVIAWGCNDDNFAPQNGPDNFRFLFIAPTNLNNNPGPSSSQGRETMRITPMGNVGIGDFSTMPEGIGLTYGQPRARLDVQFINTIPLNTDNTAINAFNNVVTNDGPVLAKRGINAVVRNTIGENVNQAIAGEFFATEANTNIGVRADVVGIGGNSTGVIGTAILVDGDSQHIGVQGFARGASQNIGVDAFAGQFQQGAFAAAVNGNSGGGSGLANSWAGFFNGDVFSLGTYFGSDEALKQNVEAIENATSVLQQIQPKSYQYNQDLDAFSLSTGIQYGVIAQQLEEVLPELVADITTPTRYTEEGEIIEGTAFKAVRYNDLIAILIAGFQEQSSVIASQEEQLSALEEQVELQASQISEMQASLSEALIAMDQAKNNMENCCLNKPSGSAMPSSGSIQLEQNIPNPFDQQTRINFTLDSDARVILEISDSNGRKLERLIDGNLGAGSHSTLWDGSRHSPGMYYYSLFANGELLTKKMIKR